MIKHIPGIITCCFLFIVQCYLLDAQKYQWYTQGNFEPLTRIEIKLKNQLDIFRKDSPIIIKRADFPLPDVHEMWVTVVDPALPPAG
jgi:hypothetical protein